MHLACLWQERWTWNFYWDYTAAFNTRCDSAVLFTSEYCINAAFKHAKIDKERIDVCMEDSGGTESNVVNTLLEKEMVAAPNKKGVFLSLQLCLSTPPLSEVP